MMIHSEYCHILIFSQVLYSVTPITSREVDLAEMIILRARGESEMPGR